MSSHNDERNATLNDLGAEMEPVLQSSFADSSTSASRGEENAAFVAEFDSPRCGSGSNNGFTSHLLHQYRMNGLIKALALPVAERSSAIGRAQSADSVIEIELVGRSAQAVNDQVGRRYNWDANSDSTDRVNSRASSALADSDILPPPLQGMGHSFQSSGAITRSSSSSSIFPLGNPIEPHPNLIAWPPMRVGSRFAGSRLSQRARTHVQQQHHFGNQDQLASFKPIALAQHSRDWRGSSSLEQIQSNSPHQTNGRLSSPKRRGRDNEPLARLSKARKKIRGRSILAFACKQELNVLLFLL